MLGHVRAAIVDAWSNAGPGHVGMAREFIRSMPSTELHAAHPELLRLVAGAIGAAVASGELTDQVPSDLAASLVLLQMVAPMTYIMSGQEADIDAAGEQARETFGNIGRPRTETCAGNATQG